MTKRKSVTVQRLQTQLYIYSLHYDFTPNLFGWVHLGWCESFYSNYSADLTTETA